ncbi:MAG: MATE family efflux transporter [Clostridia bacterium]|nr:MATE family efflux transporter [Clostridia bacterium]
MEELDLGTEKITKLLKKFAIPTIISLLVNALYNIVDQIFIGWGVNYLANGATNIVFPITVICLSFALMFGDGTSAFLSLKLGEKKNKEAGEGVANGIIISIVVSFLLCIMCLIFLPQLINIFGCTETLREFALDYGYIISMGIPFVMIGTTLNSIIRADGSPKFAMTSMVIGAVLNIILDAIAIFVLKWGIQGAAIATIVGQFVTFVMNVLYVKRFKTIKLTKESFKFNFKMAKTVSKLGVSSFITQMAIVIVISVQNSLFKAYGGISKFGAEIPITVLGIVMKINQILNSIIIGIAVGSQPIVGYNYGARKLDRVKETLKIVLGLSFTVSVIAFILFQTIPEKLISIFGSGDELYNEFACLTFRVFLMLTIFNGIQISSGIFFQAIGKPVKSAFLTLSRQILFFTPSAIIFTKFFDVMGVLYAGPISDGLAFIISSCLLVIEVKMLGNVEEKSYTVKEDRETERNEEQDIIVTIAREYGSGGRYVGKLLAEKLGIKLYDKELIEIISDNSGLSATYIEKNEQDIHGNLLSSFNTQYYNNLSNDDNLFIAETKAIKEVAQKGACVIIGRCSNYILRDNKNVINVFLYSNEKNKVKRAVKYYGLNEKNALNKINKINKTREKHYNYYTGMNWRDISNYDFAINVDKYGVEDTVEILIKLIEKMKTSLVKI